jgi:hypothetical protein
MQNVIPATPVTVRRSYLPHVKFPGLGISVTAKAIIEAMGVALNMAYVAPCGTCRKAAPDVPELNGRDPNW